MLNFSIRLTISRRTSVRFIKCWGFSQRLKCLLLMTYFIQHPTRRDLCLSNLTCLFHTLDIFCLVEWNNFIVTCTTVIKRILSKDSGFRKIYEKQISRLPFLLNQSKCTVFIICCMTFNHLQTEVKAKTDGCWPKKGLSGLKRVWSWMLIGLSRVCRGNCLVTYPMGLS